MATETSEIESRTLRIVREFRASPARVYDAWTKPEQLVKWFGPKGFSVPEHAIDPRVGGSWRTTMVSPEGSRHTVQGVYTALEKASRLCFTWAWVGDHGPGHETEVEVRFEDVDGATRMTLVQTIFENKDQRDQHESGWTSSFECLAELLGD